MKITSFKYLLMISACVHGPLSQLPLIASIRDMPYTQPEIMDIKGKAFDLRSMDGNYRLLLFVNPVVLSQKNVLYYAQTLHDNYQSKGVKIVGIFPRGALKGKEIASLDRLSFPILDDRNGIIHDKYHIKNCCGGTVLINHLNKVVFRDSVLLYDEDLRRLIEKAVMGRISYALKAIPASSFMNVQLLNNLQLLKLGTSQFDVIGNITKPRVILTFFSKACLTCGFNNRIRTLLNLADSSPGDGSMPEIGLVFPNYVDEDDILTVLGGNIVRFSVYLCPDFFPLEYKYVTDRSMKSDPFTLYLNQKTKSLFVEYPGMSEEELETTVKSVISKVEHE